MAPRLVGGLASRNRPAFEELIAEHLDALYRTALRLCGGHEADAEDLLQDATLRALEHHRSLRDPSAARPWLFTMLTRTHLNRLRTIRRRREAFEGDLDEASFEVALSEWSSVETPDEWLDRKLTAEQLAHAMDELPVELRTVVLLADAEGFTQREVAGMMDIPEGTVASRLFRARTQLRTALRDSTRPHVQRGGVAS